MTVAIAAGLAVSCSDDLNLEQKATLHVEKGDLVGTLYSESPTRVAMLDQQNSQGYPAVWSEDDNVNVFSPIRLNFNNYTLKEGAGTNQGVFEPVEEDPTLLQATDLYAITAASFQYGVSKVSADPDDKDVLLTAEIPTAFDWEKVVADNGKEVDAYKMPSPWWGPASFGSEGELNVAFRPLTAVVRVDLADLPAGVNSILLVTGNSTGVGATYTVGAVDADGAPVAGSEKEFTGTGEGISGTFNCVLSLGNSAETALGVDRHLICNDTLRVDLPEATEAKEDKVLFIPLIAQHYDKLQVIAVQADDAMPYTWYGEILRTYTDLVVNTGDLLNLSQTAQVELTQTSPLAISEAIAEMYDGKHALVVSVPNIDFSNSDDNTLYIVSNPKSQAGQTSVTINFPEEFEEGDGVNIAERNGIFTGDVPNTGAQFLRWGNDISQEDFPEGLDKDDNWEPTVKSQAKERTVRLNFNGSLENPVNVTLPTSNVEMTSGQEIDVNIITSNTANVSGYDFDATYNAVSNEQNAALKFTGVYGVVNYAGTGAVYFLEEDSEITEELNIFGKNPKSLRITDALINTISYPSLGTGSNHNSSSSVIPTAYIFTTGSAAIKWLNEPSDKIKIKAFWTSRRLTPYAVEEGYEGVEVQDPSYNIESGAVYTAAQLQGLGLAEEVYAYTISPKVESIWLGGVTFPWIGAEIEDLKEVAPTVSAPAGGTAPSVPDGAPTWAYKVGTGDKVSDPVSLDGRNVTLKNMILDIYDPNVVLPGCCGTTQKIRLTKNLGLIRTIRTMGTVDLFNIQLDDVLLDAHQYAIDNIGSLTGLIQAEDSVRIGGKELQATVSNFTDIRIASKGNQIGGIVGELETKGAPVEISNVKVESIEKNNSYIHGGHIQGKNNIGGITGRITYDGAYDDPQDEPDLGSVTEVETTTTTYYRVDRIDYEAGDWTRTYKDDENATIIQDIDGTADEKLAILHGLYYINANGEAVQDATAEKPTAGRVYYYDESCENVYGTITTYDKATTEYWCNGSKISDIMSADLYRWTAGAISLAPATKEFVDGKDTNEKTPDDFFEDATTPYNWTSNKYYTMTEVTETETQTDGGDYPTSLVVSNATVNLDNAAFDGVDQGIIKGEKGDNVGGMIGFAVINGPTNMWKAISVTVPTITATTTEKKSTLGEDMPKFGNCTGGLIGYYINVGNDDSDDPVVQSNFAGTIKARKGIVSESANAGGVIGLQKLSKIVPTTDHSDKSQAVFAQAADLTVTVGELKAVNGWVGGLVGYESIGKIDVARGTNVVTVTADKLIGANCIGGLIGEQNDMAWIATAKKVTVDVKDFQVTKPISYFEDNSDRNYCGTVGTLVGQKNFWLYVNSDNVTIKLPDAIANKDNKNLLSNDKKDALLFKYNVSAATTEQIQQGYKFYGDENGYVGFAKETSMYFVKNAQQGNYQFNIYMVY